MSSPTFSGPNSSLPVVSGRLHTPSDSAVIEPLTRAISVAVDGAVAVEYADGTQHVIPLLIAGIDYPRQVRKILATGTTATGVSVYW